MDSAGAKSAFAATAICYECVKCSVSSSQSRLTNSSVGSALLETYRRWKVEHKEVEERVIFFDLLWYRIRRQMDFMEKVASKIDEDLFDVLDNLIHQLYLCLNAATGKLDLVKKKETSKRRGLFAKATRSGSSSAAYAWKKEAINASIHDLTEWQKRFDPAWFFLLAIGDPVIDRELEEKRSRSSSESRNRGPPDAARNPFDVASGIRATRRPGQRQSVFLPEVAMDISPILYCEAKFGRLRSAEDNKWYIINCVSSRPSIPTNAIQEDVRELATKLSQSDPLAFGLLNCKGAMRVSRKADHEPETGDPRAAIYMIFRIPGGSTTLQSLRGNLLMSPGGISHTQRLRAACELAKSVSYLHTFNFVHKNIRPESILLFSDSKQCNTFLVGFDAFRAADGSTNLSGDEDWERNIYRHPQRQGVYVAEKYRMEHDIYSLGVCLLEIGLWEPFVEYSSNGCPEAGKWYADFQSWHQGEVPAHHWAWRVKEFFVHLARTILPIRMGDKYTAAVLACLTCLDDLELSNLGLTGEPKDAGSMQVAVHFIEQSLFLLNEIST